MTSPSRDAHGTQAGWVAEVLNFWFVEVPRQQWFAGGAALDAQVHARFLPVHRVVAAEPEDTLLVDAKTALAAVIVLDQFSRNMFRGTPSAFASDAKALAIAETVIAKGFSEALDSDERLFFYMPPEHQKNADAQARSLELISALGDPELTRFARAHKHTKPPSRAAVLRP